MDDDLKGIKDANCVFEDAQEAHCLQSNSHFGYRLLKRSYDFVFSVLIFVFLWWLLLIIAIAIKVDSPGPVIFKQTRIGKDGKKIQMYKFRSMYTDAHTHPERYLNDQQIAAWKSKQKLYDDPRITKVGKIIRKSSFDEFPQFLNVLIGQMSVIGPRPVTLAETYEFGDHRDEFLSIRPGITGWWQVTERNDATWEDGRRQELELWYVRNASVRIDAKIFFKTFCVMFGTNKTGW